ncbi:SymE family type I addiction module toxin [Pedobacter sp. L105]
MPLASGERIVPELRLSGLWLEQQGFHPGDLAEVTICDGTLVIKPVVL